MIIYVDTNILIAAANNKDPFHSEAVKIFQQTDLEFITGIITILEFQTVIGSLWRSKSLQTNPTIAKHLKKLSEYHQIKAITEYFLSIYPIEVVAIPAIEKYKIKSQEYEINNTMALALKISPRIPLKTLDIIQIASALKIKMLSSKKIDFFLTNDMTITKNTNNIKQAVNFIPITSNELKNLLKI
jgi:predicted nucleic acid-binding protein